ncbi:MAG: hypothetical protein II333_01465, partial [Clostridia bacterium]|nr:hypothetical protein [Clostridia bacterium]
RRISIDCTISRLSHTAREVRVSAAPDFRLYPFLGFGSLIFCRLGSLNGYAQTHQKIFFKPISTAKSGYPVQKFLRSFFQKATVSPELRTRTNSPKQEKTNTTILSIAKSKRGSYNRSTATGAEILEEKEVM